MKEEAELARKEKRNSMNRVKEKGRKKMDKFNNGGQWLVSGSVFFKLFFRTDAIRLWTMSKDIKQF